MGLEVKRCWRRGLSSRRIFRFAEFPVSHQFCVSALCARGQNGQVLFISGCRALTFRAHNVPLLWGNVDIYFLSIASTASPLEGALAPAHICSRFKFVLVDTGLDPSIVLGRDDLGAGQRTEG